MEADLWAALEAAEKSAKPAAKAKGAGQAQQAQPQPEQHHFHLLDAGLLGEVEVELLPSTVKPRLPPLTNLVFIIHNQYLIC